jgi:DNA-binding IclR family transcriptional regulator
MCVETLPGTHSLRYEESLYQRIPVALGGNSLLILADLWTHYGRGFVERYLKTLPESLRPRSIDDKVLQVEGARERGYAVSTGERVPGLSSVAVPLVGPFGQLLGMLTLSGLAKRFTRRIVGDWIPIIREAADSTVTRLSNQSELIRNAQSSLDGQRWLLPAAPSTADLNDGQPDNVAP